MISDTIKEIRKKNYLNQTEFANKIGVSQSAVSQWEHDLTRPNSDQLKAISDVFGISIDDLLAGDNQKGSSGENAPKTAEARAVSYGMDSLPQEQRELILNMVKAMYPKTFDKKGDDDDSRL